MSNAVLYNLETYEEQHNYFIGTLLNENEQKLVYRMCYKNTIKLYWGEGDEKA